MSFSSWIRTAASHSANSSGSALKKPETISLGLTRLEDRRVLSASGGEEVMLFSVNGGGAALPNVGAVESADIISYDGNRFELFFDASDVGLSGADVDGFAMVGENQFLLSVLYPVTIDGLGPVDGRDIILFEATSLGADTAGTFSLFFDGSDAGLPDLQAGNIDALDMLDDGSLLFSLEGRGELPIGGEMVEVADADVIRITPDANGSYENGTMELYLVGSKVGLTFSSEDIDALSVEGSRWRLSTWGGVGVQEVQGSAGDVFTLNVTGLGPDSSGTYEPGLFFDGSRVTGLTSNIVDALEFATFSTPNSPPIAEDVSVEVDEDGSVEIQLVGDDGDQDQDQPITYEILDGPAFGEVTDFDPATGRFTYTPNPDFFGTDQITFVVHETDANGNRLTSEPATVQVSVNSVNDAPIVHIEQSEFSGDEGQPVILHGLTVDDLEAGFNETEVVVTLQAPDGALSVAESTAVEVTGNDSNQVQLTGTIADINQLLAEGVIFQPEAEFAGATVVHVTIRDDVNPANAQTGSGSVQVEIVARREAPPQLTFHERIVQLRDSGELRRGHANFLLNVVRHDGDHRLKENALRKVEKWHQQGRIDSDLASELTARLNDLDGDDHHGRRRGHHRDHHHGHHHRGHHHHHHHGHHGHHQRGDDHHDHRHHGHRHHGHAFLDALFAQIGRGRHCGRFRA